MEHTSARGRMARVLPRVSLVALSVALAGCAGIWDAAGARLRFLAPSPATPQVPTAEPAPVAEAAQPQIQPVLTGMRQLTFDGRRTGEGYFSADGKKLVFQSEREAGNPFYQIYLLDLESGDTRRISPGYGKTTCAWIHPSGERVLFASTHADPRARAKQKEELDFRASGKERRYSWDYDESYDLWSASVDGKDLKRLTRARGYDAEGSFSPDGKWIAFASNRAAYTEKLSPADQEAFKNDPSLMMDIYLMDAEGKKPARRLTTSRGYDGGPFFSPDGSRITWRRFSEDGARAEVFTMNLDGSDERQVTQLGAMSWAPYYHPSGEYLIFTTNLQGFANFELYMVSAKGGPPVRVSELDGFDGLPVFSPAGDQLVWTRRPGRGDAGSQLFSARWNHQAALDQLARAAADASAAPAAGSAAKLAPSAPPGELRSPSIRTDVEALAAEAMDGRRTGTQGELTATQYVADAFRALGLMPAGKDGSYFDPFDFTAGISLGPDNRLAIAGASGPIAIDEKWRPLAFSATGSVAPTEVVFAGYGIVVPQTEGVDPYDSYADLDVKDRWVLVFRDVPPELTPERRQQLARYSGVRYKATTARNRGARGLIFVSGPRSEFRDPLIPLRFDVALAGTSTYALTVADAVAEQLLAKSGKTLDELQGALAKGQVVPGFAIPEARLEATVDLQTQKSTGRNVVGRLVLGGEPAGPPLVIGAHVDHLGRGGGSDSLARDEEQDRVHHGADDNASGVAALIEVARRLAADRAALANGRDVIFAAWSGEELGLLGSDHFVAALPGPNPHGTAGERAYAAYLNMDMVGRLREQLYIQGTGSSSKWPSAIERANVSAGLPLALSSDSYLPTDATSFYLKGIPMLSFFTGVHEEYHTPRDLPEKINFEGIEQISGLVTGVARGLQQAREPIDYVQVQRSAKDPGRANIRVYLGTIPSYGQQDVKGVLLSGVSAGGPADKAGVLADDTIVELAGSKVENIYDYTYALEAMKVGQEADIVVLRKGERVPLKITPTSRD